MNASVLSFAVTLMASFLFVAPSSSTAQTRNIEVDFSKVLGAIKPLNGVNGGPLMMRGNLDLSSNFSELGVKHVRLHDIPWMYNNVVDIQYVFSRFDADVNDPQSYDFFLTDHYIKSIKALGAEITYRLGLSAEVPPIPVSYNNPPRDFAKWAAICAHIVQHYNQGWANGYHYNIKYWEIWNEPDLDTDAFPTLEKYYKLYEVTARALKSVDPSVNVGGPTPGSPDRSKYFGFVEGFLKYCADRKIPLDFVAWHDYASGPDDITSRAVRIQELLDKYGFSKVENVLDEWNYSPPGGWDLKNPKGRRHTFGEQMGGLPGAVFDASVLIYLQDTTVGVADYYTGTHMWWGLFDEYGAPRKAYFTFKAFKLLLDTPQRVSTSGSGQDGFAVIAGLSKDKSEATILISNFRMPYNRYNITLRGLSWNRSFTYEKYAVDRSHDLALTKSEKRSPGVTISEDVETPSVCLIRLRAVP
jgi:hypothetical protein